MIVTVVTVLFIAAAVFGVGLRAKSLRESVGDRIYVMTKYADGSKDAALIMADGCVRTEAIGLVVKLVFVAVGVGALLAPPPNTSDAFRVYRVFLFMALFAVVVAMDVNSWIGRNERREVLRLERQEDLLKDGAG